MPKTMNFLELTREALSEVSDFASSVKNAAKLGKEQADIRAGVIRTINEMCDALQLAGDLISREISTSIVEYNNFNGADEQLLRGYFERTASRFSESHMRLLLHEGKVCGELHALGDRFTQPFSPEAMSAVKFWDNVKAFFYRSTSMSQALEGLHEGELNYLRDFSTFLDDVRDQAETALGSSWGDMDELVKSGDKLVELMRDKRQTLQEQLMMVRTTANECVSNLH